MSNSRQYIDPASPLRIDLKASVGVRVDNDEMTVTFEKEEVGSDIAQLNDAVLKGINQAIAIAKSFPAVLVKTGNISTRENWRDRDDDKSEERSFTVSAGLTLISTDLSGLGKLSGILAQTLKLESVSHGLSSERRHAEQMKLIQALADEFKAKAEALTTSFGYNQYTIRALKLDPSQEAYIRTLKIPAPAFAVASMSIADGPEKEVESLAAEGGKTSVLMEVSGVIELR